VSKPPFTLAVAAVVLALEGLTVLGLGGYVAVQTVVGEPHDVATSIAEAAIGVLVGAALVWVAWGAYGAQRWARSPGVLAQIFAVPVAVTLIQSGSQAAGAVLLLAAVTVFATLLAPASTRVLYGGAFPGAPEPAGDDDGPGDAPRGSADPAPEPTTDPSGGAPGKGGGPRRKAPGAKRGRGTRPR
jgi:hypothetical protein